MDRPSRPRQAKQSSKPHTAFSYDVIATQICHEFERFSKRMRGIKIANFFGGLPIADNKELLKKETPNIVVGTPGRIKQVGAGKGLVKGAGQGRGVWHRQRTHTLSHRSLAAQAAARQAQAAARRGTGGSITRG